MPNIDYDDLRRIGDYIKGYRNFPFPVVICNLDFKVLWSNALAKMHHAQLTGTASLRDTIAEFEQEELLSELRQEGNVLLSNVLSLQDDRLALMPIYSEGELHGVLLMVLGAEASASRLLNSYISYTPYSLIEQISNTVDNIFAVLDHLAEKSGALGLGWIDSHLNRIAWHSYRELRSVTNISEYIRLQNDDGEYNYRVVDLFGWMEEVSETVSDIAEDCGVPVSFHIPAEECRLQLDLEKFEHAFFNLLHNSLLYTRPGNHIEVRAAMTPSEVAVTVTDRGLGIPPAMQEEIFRPYIVYPHDEIPNGIGLGLTVARRLIQAMDGSLTVESVHGEGSSFTIRLPIQLGNATLTFHQSELNEYRLLHDRFSPLYIGLAGLYDSTSKEDEKRSAP